MPPGGQKGASVRGGLHRVERDLHATADEEDEVVMELTQPSLIVMDILRKNTEKKYVKRVKIWGKTWRKNTSKG